MKKVALAIAIVCAAFALVGCGKKETAAKAPEAPAAAAPGEEAGFTEIPIFEDEKADFLNVSAVYFQPVPMSDGINPEIPAEAYDIHLECDVSALDNDLGYGTGDWVPYLTIDYEVSQDGAVAAAGTFMEMSASDGPHYGANIKLPNAGTYALKFTIHSPGENGYLIHTDSATGPGGLLQDHFANGNIVVSYDKWDYLGPQK